MIQTSYKAIIEDSSRNKFFFYNSGTSVCCKEVNKDGIARDSIIASQVSDQFLTAIDLQDNIFVICVSNDKGIYLFQYIHKEWKLEQILNIQGTGNIIPLSLFAFNGSIHIIYAKQMAIANFYNIYHLYKSGNSNTYQPGTSWKKNNISEIYADDLTSAYSAAITKDGAIQIVNEWFDGTNFLISHHQYDGIADTWKKKDIATLFKKEITVSMLYDDNVLHLLCYTFEDETSAVFYYIKKDASIKDFEFSCLEKINTEEAISPFFHLESGTVYMSWLHNTKYSQYALQKDQKNWTKKIEGNVPNQDIYQSLEYIRNRKNKALIIKKTYFKIDYKHNITLPYFKDNMPEGMDAIDSETKKLRSAEGDLVRYIPYLIEEVKALTEMVKTLCDKVDQLESRSIPAQAAKKPSFQYKESEKDRDEEDYRPKRDTSQRLNKSNFRSQFMNSNKLLNKPEASAIFVGSANVPDPEKLSEKEGIPFADNNSGLDNERRTNAESQAPAKAATSKPNLSTPSVPVQGPNQTAAAPPSVPAEPVENAVKPEQESYSQKDSNVFRKIGDFFK